MIEVHNIAQKLTGIEIFSTTARFNVNGRYRMWLTGFACKATCKTDHRAKDLSMRCFSPEFIWEKNGSVFVYLRFPWPTVLTFKFLLVSWKRHRPYSYISFGSVDQDFYMNFHIGSHALKRRFHAYTGFEPWISRRNTSQIVLLLTNCHTNVTQRISWGASTYTYDKILYCYENRRFITVTTKSTINLVLEQSKRQHILYQSVTRCL